MVDAREECHSSFVTYLLGAAAVVGAGWFAYALHRASGQPIRFDGDGYISLSRSIVFGKERSGATPAALDSLRGTRLIGYPHRTTARATARLGGLHCRGGS